jgi:hypothetical protein
MSSLKEIIIGRFGPVMVISSWKKTNLPFQVRFTFIVFLTCKELQKGYKMEKEAWHENRLIFTAWLVTIQNGMFSTHSAKSSQIVILNGGRPG